jgi:hypothetical protein
VAALTLDRPVNRPEQDDRALGCEPGRLRDLSAG